MIREAVNDCVDSLRLMFSNLLANVNNLARGIVVITAPIDCALFEVG